MGNSMTLTCLLADAIDSEWSRMAAIRLGDVPSTLPTPAHYVLVLKDDRPFKTIEVHLPRQTFSLFIEAQIWEGWIAVGFGCSVFLVSVDGDDICEVDLDQSGKYEGNYFAGFSFASDFLLARSGYGLTCIDRRGATKWRNYGLGLDGVTIDGITSDTITGEGEWDPPGGSRPFAVWLDDGRNLKGRP
ncbi:hypothetical protein [Bauldia litoralis]|uniref:Uncharacterized protein n=1 Tax=Bauldia litoralis TaxID=665467 RepID=A0A1G6EM31_9HYPH|nr:hypothetical protein [Bauldia litoralis]SDB58444.1 hypothetical protein SAMN02982931_04681 [Bauldia litoralis]